MIYLDHASTTPLDGEVLSVMMPYLTTDFGNASSQHSLGRASANAVIAARDCIANIMGVPARNLYFTSGGTEACNTAIKGVAYANADRGKHLVISAIEHHAMLSAASDLQRHGFTVTLVKPDGNGVISARAIAEAITPQTAFVGVMSANNEVGTVQPVADIYAVCKERGVFFFCDCVQTAGVLDFKQFPADGIAFSAHKFYGPKGFGGLYMGGNARFERLIAGGEQERGLRGGTTFTAGAVGCAYALKKAYDNAAANNARVARLRDLFVKQVLGGIEGTHLNGDKKLRLPANANISFDGRDGEQILFGLDLRGIAVSTGSACSSGAVNPSHVLTAMGLPEERVRGAVRFTFGKNNTEDEVIKTVAELKSVVAKIRG